MQFGFLSECQTPRGMTHYARYWEVIDEAVYAEEMGFDFFGTSEQHFICDGATVSAPECFYPMIFAKTSRLRLRHCITLLPFNFNHPIRVAERVATLDIVSRGRIELGTGRANTLLQIEGFGINPKDTRAQWIESLEVIGQAFTKDPFAYEGKHLVIPPRSLVPKPIQQPHPPISVASSSPEMHEIAARKGIGIMSLSNFYGWDYLERNIKTYKRTLPEARPVGGCVNDRVGVLVVGYCAETNEAARQDGKYGVVGFASAITLLYPELAKKSPDYAYMAQAESLGEKLQDLDYLVEESGGVVLGDPDTCIQQIEHLRSLGIGEILLRIDGHPHHKIMRSLELFGKYVIPHFKHPQNIVREGLFPEGIT